MAITKINRIYKYQLDADLVVEGTFNIGKRVMYYGDDDSNWWLKLGPYNKITIRDGYQWDGCSPKFARIGPIWFGTIDTKRNVKGSCVHDALYQFGLVPGVPYSKKDADQTFYKLLEEDGFLLAGTYHWAVDKIGKYEVRKNVKFIKQQTRGRLV